MSSEFVSFVPTKSKINPIDSAQMVWIPPGDFLMGSVDSDEIADDSEKPQRTVFLDGYWMYKYPVTVAQFRTFSEAASYSFDWAKDKSRWDRINNHPMVEVTWHDAQAYCQWAGGDLPTEAQWEKAARGTDGRKFPWGNDFDRSKLWSGYRKRSASVYRSSHISLSVFGCADMVGNVAEWCRDWYYLPYYASAPTRNPTGPDSGSNRVSRSGVFNQDDEDCFRVTSRHAGNPWMWFGHWGFRASLPAFV